MRVWQPVLATVLAAAAIFYFFQGYLVRASFDLTSDGAVMSQIEASLEDQKTLAKFDPGSEALYRARFDELETTTQRLRILDHNRERLAQRYQYILLGIFSLSTVSMMVVYGLRQRHQAIRLEHLREAITRLAEGRTGLVLGLRGRDTIARIGDMIERTSKVIGRDRQRLVALRNLSSWQEATRRLAHEMRTPLAAAQLELDRMRSQVVSKEPSEEVDKTARSVAEELSRLAAFTRGFASFAQLSPLNRTEVDIGGLVNEFVHTFDKAWANLDLVHDLEHGRKACVDVGLMRQVLTNLCDNSSRALGDQQGRVMFRVGGSAEGVHIDVADDGPGILEAMRERIFEPYASTQSSGEGMGLGMAISKKILLDHGGDLELVTSTSSGTIFRLMLPVERQPSRDRCAS